ncbi:acyl-CoA dehydrogenase family protein [Neobacillus niacini]|uniref:acyl-CoA dehydrogenase family protein n=1 Tax=Neobacillus niacini TaxID=86668 RepID=UPI002FFDAFD2
MNFSLSEEEQMLQSTARKYLESLGGIQLSHDYMLNKEGTIHSLWDGVSNLGLTGLLVPEKYEGMGLGLTSMIPIAEEIGRYLLPLPFLESAIFGTVLISMAGTEEQKMAYLTGIADGSIQVGLCLNLSEHTIEKIPSGILAKRINNSFVLTGEISHVRYGMDVNHFIVIADVSGEVQKAVFLVTRNQEGITVKPGYSLDRTAENANIIFNNVIVHSKSLLGGKLGLLGVLESTDAMNASLCSTMVGGMGKVVEMAAEYAKIRQQFGQPIGRFQAIKHRIADMKVELEISRSLSYYAAIAIDDQLPNKEQIVSAAKAFCSEAYVRIASHNIQIHGGIGVTAEHDAHLYLKRAKVVEGYGGTPVLHRERIADDLNLREEVPNSL